MKLQCNFAVYKITFGTYFLMASEVMCEVSFLFFFFFSTAVLDSRDMYFLSPASANILVQELASTCNQTAVFSAPKEK